MSEKVQSPGGAKDIPLRNTSISAVPDGTHSHPLGNPAMNRWAIFFRPAGLGNVHTVVTQRVAETPEFLDGVGHSPQLMPALSRRLHSVKYSFFKSD